MKFRAGRTLSPSGDASSWTRRPNLFAAETLPPLSPPCESIDGIQRGGKEGEREITPRTYLLISACAARTAKDGPALEFHAA